MRQVLDSQILKSQPMISEYKFALIMSVRD